VIEQISDVKGVVYFTAVGDSVRDLEAIRAQEVKLPAESISTIDSRLSKLRTELRGWDNVYARAAATLPAIEVDTEILKDRLQFLRTVAGGESAADGSLAVMEAWAREKQAPQVDAMLDAHPDVIAIREQPTPEDETPVELQNSRFASPFEFIGKMYALPKYGTMDLTRWFAPFYMLFFAFCLADAGYGLLLFLGGLFLYLKTKGVMATIGKLSMWCGGAAIVFGFLVGSLFGLDIKTWAIFAGKPLFFPTDSMFLFGLSIALGVFQLVFGMILKVVTTARVFGFKYALATIGWIIVILTGVVMVAPGMIGVELSIPTTALYVSMGIGGFMMLFLNNPGKNPLVNLGGGLWNTYNDVTGLMSDVLSYIRLFAIGLSGGVLAAVFNNLAVGVSPDIPVVKQLVMLIILLIGHGLNLFMSTLSSMVHPMRLTFVEFYKNAGFEMAARTFSPLKRSEKRQ
jgi:V/A-type H+-transporting ATPase subunit I